MMKIVTTKLDDDWLETDVGRILLTINENKKKRLMKLRKTKDIQRGIAGELLLQYVLKSSMNISDFEIEYSKNGKPYLKNYDNIFFNISHSGDYVICVIAESEVGIDIEEIIYDYCRYEGLDKYIFSNTEINKLATLELREKSKYFFDLWTQKEAFAKCLGLGLSLYDSFRFDLPPKQKLIFGGKYYYFKKINISKGYKSYVCSEDDQIPEIQMVSGKVLLYQFRNYNML